MNSLLVSEIKMTSLDLAEITGKEHKNVLRDIRNEIKGLGDEIGRLIFEPMSYKDSYSREQQGYSFGRKGAMQLALKYDPVTRYKVIEKIEELEGESKVKVPQTFAEALRLAADLEEEKQKLLPKAEYFDALVDRNLLTNFRDTAKELKVKQNDFIQWLIDNKYIYRDSKNKPKPYAEYVPELFELKEFAKENYSDNQTLITPKGRETFRLLIKKERVNA